MKSKSLTIFVANVGLAASVCVAQSTNLASQVNVSSSSRLVHYNLDSQTHLGSQVALAKSGHVEQLQQIYCELYDGRMGIMFEAGTVKLPQVGGWFAINSYLQLFDADARFRKAKSGPPDLMYTLPSQWGLKFLPTLVPDPPLQYNEQSVGHNSGSQVETWKRYIASHENELSKLEPTGIGVKFSSEACKNGKPRMRHKS